MNYFWLQKLIGAALTLVHQVSNVMRLTSGAVEQYCEKSLKNYKT